MGTRNITSVIMNGEQRVCQYGQWDGYPTWMGAKILEFFRDADIEHFKKALENTKISVVDVDDALFYTGSTKHTSDIFDRVWEKQTELNKKRQNNEEYLGTYETVKYMAKNGELSEQEVDDYLVSTRDTGCAILSYIYERPLEKEPLELFALTDEFNGQYSWEIQGIYVIDLDKSTVKMTYDGYTQEYRLDKLPTNIEKEMLIFEKATYELYELFHSDFDFENISLGVEDGKESDGLWDKAGEIAEKIGLEIKADHPELLGDTDEPICAEDFGQEKIFVLLCEEILNRKVPTKSVDDLVANAISKCDGVISNIDSKNSVTLVNKQDELQLI